MTENIVNIERKLDREISLLFKQYHKSNIGFPNRKNLTYESFLSDKILIIIAIREGIPYSLFELIQQDAPFSEYDWANFLDISTKSLLRYRNAAKPFKSTQSEKIIEIAEVTKAGLEVFEDMGKFKLWLNTPNFSLGKMKPIELLKDSYGKELVLGELTRINYGILA